MKDLSQLLLERVDIGIPSGASVDGGLMARWRQLLQVCDGDIAHSVLAVEPGDLAIIGSDEVPRMALSLPVAVDVWYLFHCPSILNPDLPEQDERVLDALSWFLDHAGNVRPLRTLRDKTDLTRRFSAYQMRDYFTSSGPSIIKEMRFETAEALRSFKYNSTGPGWYVDPGTSRNLLGGEGNLFAGYLAFPVGPLGVMEVQSVMSDVLVMQSVTVSGNEFYKVNNVEIEAISGGEMFPPKPFGLNQCAGMHLIEDGYLAVHADVEYPAEDFSGVDAAIAHNWLRLWLRRDGTWPMPGEFIGLLCKPQATPPHVWWFQETSPFLYSGNWFETKYLTSGQVLAVIPDDTNEYGVPILKVRVKEEVIYLTATDIYDYETDFNEAQALNEPYRVAILKGSMIEDNMLTLTDYSTLVETEHINMTWQDLVRLSPDAAHTVEQQMIRDAILLDAVSPEQAVNNVSDNRFPGLVIDSDITTLDDDGWTRVLILHYNGQTESITMTLVYEYESYVAPPEGPENCPLADRTFTLTSAELSLYGDNYNMLSSFYIRDHGASYDWNIMKARLESLYSHYQLTGEITEDAISSIIIDSQWDLTATDPRVRGEWIVVPITFYGG